MDVVSRRINLAAWIAPLAFVALLAPGKPARAIVGGQPASLFEYPWLAQISVSPTGHECGGALLAPTWVLTAAHCVAGKTKEQVTVTLGEYDRTWNDWTEQMRSVAEIVPFQYPADYNDIVLLRLSSAVTYTLAVQPIEVADGDYEPGTTAWVAGWGATQYLGPATNALLETSFPIVSNEVCTPANIANGTVHAKEVCTGVPPNGSASCKGDSGGPVVVSNGFGGKVLIGLVSWGGMSGGLGCKPYTVSVRARDYKPWIEAKVFGSRPPVCSGRTAPGETLWLDGGTDVLHTWVDTTPCGWTSTPLYSTSLGGNSNHSDVNASSAIYEATAKGFRVFLYKSGLTAADADARDYHINWQSVANNTNVSGLCTGKSSRTAWVQYQANGIYTDVSTAACGLGATPAYFTAIGGSEGHGLATGVTSIYQPSANGFRVYLQATNATPARADSFNWQVLWRAENPTANFADLCNGATTAGNTSWVQSGANRVYTDVNTSACTIATTPKFFTVLGGTSSHWTAKGVTSIYTPTADGFRVYVNSSGITPALANQRSWHVRWNALP